MIDFDTWSATPQAKYAQQWVMPQVDAIVSQTFGYYALQLGWPHYPCLRTSTMPHQILGVNRSEPPIKDCSQTPALMMLNYHELPFKNNSLDLVVLPHTFEFTESQHDLLREVERVLIPEGRLLVIGFNPFSLWGIRHQYFGMGYYLPCQDKLLSLTRLKDWLKLLAFDVDRGRYGVYQFPYSSSKGFSRTQFLEAAGDRWWPTAGSVYIISAVKRVHGMRLIGTTKHKKIRHKGLVPVASAQSSDGSI